MYKKKLTFISLIIIALIVFSSINISIEAKSIFPGRDELKRYLDNSYSKLYCVMPSNAVVGQPIRITIQAWDWCERICKRSFKSVITFSSTDSNAILPDDFSFKFRYLGAKTIENGITFNTPGIHYVILTDEINDIFTVGNPVIVTEQESEYKWYWGDIHFHSLLSDGSGTPAHNYRYARDTSMLDFGALSDHDEPAGELLRWNMVKRAAKKFYEPGRFVTLLAYEYSNSGGNTSNDGHYNVYYNTVDDAHIYRCSDDESDRIFELWSLLREWKNKTGHDVFTVPHHLVDYGMPWNSDYYDSELVPLVEICQPKGSSEMLAARGNPIYNDREILESGHSVQDGLAKGYKFGFMASSDEHHGHPGRPPPTFLTFYLTAPGAHIGPFLYYGPPAYPYYWIYTGLQNRLNFFKRLLQQTPNYSNYTVSSSNYGLGGLTGVLAKNLTREEIFNALKDRRCIAVTNANRMLIDFTINNQGVGNGSEVYVPDVNTPRIINCSVAGTAPIANVTVVKNNETFFIADGKGTDPHNLSNYIINFSIVDTEPITGMAWDKERNTGGRDVYYVRIMQTNKLGFAWIGPIWVNPFNTN